MNSKLQECITGYWGLPDHARGRVHAVRNHRPVCGDKVHPDAQFQWCASYVVDEYIECKRCREIINRWRQEGANPMKVIKNAKPLERKSRGHVVTQESDFTFRVKSGTSGKEYKVTLLRVGGAICSCGWGVHRSRRANYRSACSHVQAVYNHMANLIDRRSFAWASAEAAQRQHRPITDIQDGVVLTSRKEGT